MMDPSDVDWEIRYNIGTLYVSTSRGKSLGSRTERFPTDSAIYWTGMGTGIDRLKNCRYKKSGEECEAYKKDLQDAGVRVKANAILVERPQH